LKIPEIVVRDCDDNRARLRGEDRRATNGSRGWLFDNLGGEMGDVAARVAGNVSDTRAKWQNEPNSARPRAGVGRASGCAASAC